MGINAEYMGSPVVPLIKKMNFKFLLAVFVVAVALMPTAHSNRGSVVAHLRLKEVKERLAATTSPGGNVFTVTNTLGDRVNVRVTMVKGSCADNIDSVGFIGIPRGGFMEYGDPQPRCAFNKISVLNTATGQTCEATAATLRCNGVDEFVIKYLSDPGCEILCGKKNH